MIRNKFIIVDKKTCKVSKKKPQNFRWELKQQCIWFWLQGVGGCCCCWGGWLIHLPCRLGAPPLLGRVMVPLWCCSQWSGLSSGLTVTTFRASVSPDCRISCTTRSCDARTTFSPLIYKDNPYIITSLYF